MLIDVSFIVNNVPCCNCLIFFFLSEKLFLTNDAKLMVQLIRGLIKPTNSCNKYQNLASVLGGEKEGGGGGVEES